MRLLSLYLTIYHCLADGPKRFSMTSLSWCKCSNRRCSRSSSIALQQCITRPIHTGWNRCCSDTVSSREDALVHFNLALLEARRDIAMLGLLHRSVLGNGFCLRRRWFFRNITSNFVFTGRHLQMLARSAFGLFFKKKKCCLNMRLSRRA